MSGILAFGVLALVLGLVLGLLAQRLRGGDEDQEVVDQIDQLLPQTQCGQCGYPGCRPYAEAIAAGEADINRCPPGGEAGVRALADLLAVEPKPLDPDCGEPAPPMVAVIDETICIGCRLCIQACPVDAILGAPKRMHTVIEAECTGCELCVEPCPVDCISMVEPTPNPQTWRYRKDRLKVRVENRTTA
ncbi:MAG: electron transport complex subunit RsxB [Xanthomonadales bacterium]|nr:electron transport complex subunit RsxB [Xanthomonadales bacterium]